MRLQGTGVNLQQVEQGINRILPIVGLAVLAVTLYVVFRDFDGSSELLILCLGVAFGSAVAMFCMRMVLLPSEKSTGGGSFVVAATTVVSILVLDGGDSRFSEYGATLAMLSAVSGLFIGYAADYFFGRRSAETPDE